MINVKITNRTAAEDYIAVEKETGATTLPGKHIFAIFSVGIISVLLALPFGSIIPESASPFTALSTGREEQNRVYEQEYLKNNEVIAEANVEISSTAGSEENYDDDINTEALIAQASQAEIKKEREAAQAAATAEPEQRVKFVATDIEKNSSEKILADKKTQSEKYISSILAPNRIPGTIAPSETEKVFKGKWYEQTIRKGDSLSKIFSYLNLNNDDLKKITAVARDSDLNLSVGQKIQFLIAEDNSVQEIAIPLSGNKQVRFSRDIEKNTYTVARERRFAQFSDLKSRGMDSATLMPSFIEAEKERNKKRLEQEALLSQKQKEELEKARLKREQLAAQKKQDALLAAAEKEKSKSIYKGKTRPRLIIGSIVEKESFDKAAARYGLTHSEIVTIKNQYVGRINFNKLSAGDSFRILFNGIGQGSSMTAISMNTKMFGQINLYRHQLNHIFYEENGYNPSTGAFRRFPIMGQIKVSSPFNLRRFHPIRQVIRPHYGVDFKVNIGTPIYAPADGVVTYAKYMRGGGYSIIINHKGGYSTVYMHLSKFDVQQGDHVHIGQIIAKSGNTGNSTGAHLHYEVHVNGRPVDPLKVDLPSGSPATAQRLKEAFKNNVYILKTELYKNKLAEVK